MHRHFPAHIFPRSAPLRSRSSSQFFCRSAFSLTIYLFVFDFHCVGVKWREGSSKGKYNYSECSCPGIPSPRLAPGYWPGQKARMKAKTRVNKSFGKYFCAQITSRCKNYLRILFWRTQSVPVPLQRSIEEEQGMQKSLTARWIDREIQKCMDGWGKSGGEMMKKMEKGKVDSKS